MIQIAGNSPLSATGTTQCTDPALEKAAKAFEAVFVRQMIGAMRSASLSEGMFDSSATEQFRDMADARTAENMADSGAMGIANLLLKQLSPLVQSQTAGETTTAKGGEA